MNIRMTFAIGNMGPSSDGDSGEYYLASIVRPKPAEYLLNLSLREWAEAQMLDALEAQGQLLGEHLAFVTFMGSEEEVNEAAEDE